MIYVTASFWILVMVLLAGGIHHLWSTMVKPKTISVVLLPGSLIANLAQTVALLITGVTFSESGNKEPPKAQPKLPLIGPLLIALVPMLALCVVLIVAMVKLGNPIVAKLPPDKLATELPRTMSAFWDQLVGLIRLAESALNSIRDPEIVPWKVALFVYLLICLSVQLAPGPGNIRGHLGAIITLGLLGWLVGSVMESFPDVLRSAWPMMALTIGWLVLLLLFSLVVRAAVSTAKTLFLS